MEDLSKHIALITVTWLLTSFAIIAVALRFYVRHKVVKKVTADDWFMLLALLAQVTAQGFVTHAWDNGAARHDVYLSLDQLIIILKDGWIFTTPATIASVLARISICLLMIKIFGTKRWFKHYLIIITTLQTIAGILVIVLIWAQCRPVAALWDPRLVATGQAICWNPHISQDTSYLVQAFFALSDLTFVIIPVSIVWRLNMSIQKKIGLIIVLSLGLFTMVASILKAVTSQSTGTTYDAQYHACNSLIWATVEQSLVIALGCVPPLMACSQLQIPSFRDISISLRHLVSRRHSQTDSPETSPHRPSNDDGSATYDKKGDVMLPQISSGASKHSTSGSSIADIIDGRSGGVTQFSITSPSQSQIQKSTKVELRHEQR